MSLTLANDMTSPAVTRTELLTKVFPVWASLGKSRFAPPHHHVFAPH